MLHDLEVAVEAPMLKFAVWQFELASTITEKKDFQLNLTFSQKC